MDLTRNAVLGRIRRRLAKKELRLVVARSYDPGLGAFYEVNGRNVVERSGFSWNDLEKYARSLGAIGAKDRIQK